MDITITVLIVLGLVLLFVFARSAAREARRITIEVDHRINSLDALLESMDADEQEAERLVRRSSRHKARAEEVAGRQPAGWKVVSKLVRKLR